MATARGNKYHAVTTTERQEQRAIVDLLRSVGGQVWVIGTTRKRGDHPGAMQTPGLADIFAVVPAKGDLFDTAVWIEVKAAGGRMRPAQVEFQRCCKAACIGHLVGGVDVVLDWLKRGGWIK